jgi:pimeloyl-ACP methyl ester carboxylesterase
MARSLLAIVVALSLAAAGCGGDERDRQGSATTTSSTPAAGVPPGKLVEIGGGRSLFVHCVGSGSPTVVLEGGDSGYAAQWQDVQPQLARTTRVCAYDRAGAGNSLPTHGVRDARDETGDLRRLLAHGRIDPPYVVVGHSYGGVLVRVFAHQHPTRTAGIVLIDTMGRDGRRRQLAIWPTSQAPEVRAGLATTVLNDVDLAIGEAMASRVGSLGNTPLAVIDAARQSNLADVPPRLRRRLQRLWARMHDELAGLSSDSVHVTALRSDHDVASASMGQPAVVVRAVQEVVRAARNGDRLPPCTRTFRGPDVRCGS